MWHRQSRQIPGLTMDRDIVDVRTENGALTRA
jgi:hypothetical protein